MPYIVIMPDIELVKNRIRKKSPSFEAEMAIRVENQRDAYFLALFIET